MKKSILNLIVVMFCIFISSCNRTNKNNEYVKKVEYNKETIAVGIYKATGFEYSNIQYIAEALKIDKGIVYVTLTDADVLKTKLENIDVILFAGTNNGQKMDKLDDEIAVIFKDFISKRGKGAVGICNGVEILTNAKKCQSLDLVNIELKENAFTNIETGLVKFKLSPQGVEMFPELIDYENLLIDFHNGPKIEILDTVSGINVLGQMDDREIYFPLFINSSQGNGKIVITNTNPETTPGMRWIIPRMVRWSANKELRTYGNNVIRPDFLKTPINIDKELKSKIEKLLITLEEGKEDEVILAMDNLQKIYPWIAAEKVRLLLIRKNDDIMLRAAKYLVDIEYTMAIDDINKLINRKRRKKVKEQLIAYKNELEKMIE